MPNSEVPRSPMVVFSEAERGFGFEFFRMGDVKPYRPTDAGGN